MRVPNLQLNEHALMYACADVGMHVCMYVVM